MRATPFRVAAAVLLALLFALEVYRAITQSLVHDEAFTYQLYLAAPFSAIFTVFDANHHFLSTLLMRLSAACFGHSEAALRLPALVACAGYFVTVFRLADLAFGESPLLLLAVALSTANPLVLDFMAAARGYGLALALLTYALYCAVAYFAKPRPGRLVGAGAAAGLAIAANLTAFFPAAAMTAALLAMLRPREWKVVLFPMAAIVASFVAVSPVHRASAANFYYGAPSLLESVRNLAALSLAHNSGLGGWNREVFWKPWWRDFAAAALALITACGIALAMRTPRDPLLTLACAALGGAWLVLIVGHQAIALHYPLDRTGVCLLGLTGWVIAAVASHVGNRALSYACVAIGAAIAIEYAMQLQWRYFYVWQYDADTKSIVKLLEQAPRANARVGASWPLTPSLNYYRETRHLDWMQPLRREELSGRYDYYVLIESEQALAAREGLRVLYRGAVSGTALYAPAP